MSDGLAQPSGRVAFSCWSLAASYLSCCSNRCAWDLIATDSGNCVWVLLGAFVRVV